MKFVALFEIKDSVDQTKLAEAIGRRAEYQHPAGVKLLEEYWSPEGTIVSIFESDDPAAMMIMTAAWVDVDTVRIFPVVTWQEGFEALSEHLGR
jgi:hypothetical protein